MYLMTVEGLPGVGSSSGPAQARSSPGSLQPLWELGQDPCPLGSCRKSFGRGAVLLGKFFERNRFAITQVPYMEASSFAGCFTIHFRLGHTRVFIPNVCWRLWDILLHELVIFCPSNGLSDCKCGFIWSSNDGQGFPPPNYQLRCAQVCMKSIVWGFSNSWNGMCAQFTIVHEHCNAQGMEIALMAFASAIVGGVVYPAMPGC